MKKLILFFAIILTTFAANANVHHEVQANEENSYASVSDAFYIDNNASITTNISDPSRYDAAIIDLWSVEHNLYYICSSWYGDGIPSEISYTYSGTWYLSMEAYHWSGGEPSFASIWIYW